MKNIYKAIKKILNLKKISYNFIEKNLYNIKTYPSNYKNTFNKNYSVFSVDGSFFKEHGFIFYTIQSVLIKYGKEKAYENKEFFYFQEDSSFSSKVEEKMINFEYLTIKKFIESKINSEELILIIADAITFDENQKNELFELNKKNKKIKIISYFSSPFSKDLSKKFNFNELDINILKKFLKKDFFSEKIIDNNLDFSIFLNSGTEISKIIFIKNNYKENDFYENNFFLDILFSQIKKGSGFPLILQYVHKETQKIEILKNIINNNFNYFKTKNLTKFF